MLPPPTISTAHPEGKRVSKIKEVVKEQLDILERKRKGHEEKRAGNKSCSKDGGSAEKKKKNTSSSERHTGAFSSTPSERALYIDEKTWGNLEERHAIQDREAR